MIPRIIHQTWNTPEIPDNLRDFSIHGGHITPALNTACGLKLTTLA